MNVHKSIQTHRNHVGIIFGHFQVGNTAGKAWRIHFFHQFFDIFDNLFTFMNFQRYIFGISQIERYQLTVRRAYHDLSGRKMMEFLENFNETFLQ